MRIEAVAAGPIAGPERCLTGVSAALAEARKVFREAAPGLSWPAVTAEANRISSGQNMTMLQALDIVLDRIAVSGPRALGR